MKRVPPKQFAAILRRIAFIQMMNAMGEEIAKEDFDKAYWEDVESRKKLFGHYKQSERNYDWFIFTEDQLRTMAVEVMF